MATKQKTSWYLDAFDEDIVTDFVQSAPALKKLREAIAAYFQSNSDSYLHNLENTTSCLIDLLEEFKAYDVITERFPRLDNSRGGGFRTDDEAGQARPTSGDVKGQENRFVDAVKKVANK
jgi:hypothetical protein